MTIQEYIADLLDRYEAGEIGRDELEAALTDFGIALYFPPSPFADPEKAY
jgi:hypothetical protein